MSNINAFPLSWPIQHPRTKYREPSKFRRVNRSRHSIEEARTKLYAEIQRLGGQQVVLSSNLLLRLDGHPRGNQCNPADPGVAVYFKRKAQNIVLPCDRWYHVECNIWAIACHIETLRSQERWGVGTLNQAFAGYMQLEEKTEFSCWELLGLDPRTATKEGIASAYREKAKLTHPDMGGSEEAFAAIANAREVALQLVK